MTPEDDVPFGELLRRYRLAAYLTQEVLAERAHLSVRAISDLERGIKRTPHNDTLDLLARALALPAKERAAFKAAARRQRDQAPLFPGQVSEAATGEQISAQLARDGPAAAFIFVAYAPADGVAAKQLCGELAARGVACWVDRPDRAPASGNWEQALRDAIRACQAVALVATPNVHQSRQVPDELRVAEMYRRPIYAVWVGGDEWMECIPIGWGSVQRLDARGPAYEGALSELAVIVQRQARHEAALPPPNPKLVAVPRNPYKGLRAFQSRDAGDFFGREALIAALLAALRAQQMGAPRFLAVIGPSGSGKSSVVMAGLLPRLRRGALPGSNQWMYLKPMVPGVAPLEALTLTLAQANPGSSLATIRDDLDASPRGLHLLARRLAPDAQARVVLIVDQAEELFATAVGEPERQHFIDLLLAAVTEPGGPLLVILTLRADFYDRPLRYPELGALLSRQHETVLALSAAELRDVIERPAALPDVGLTFDEDLVGDLLFEVRGQAGALPLLEFTLDRLFERRDDRRLTVAAFREFGGVRGALSGHAEATYERLPSGEHRRLARALFLRLIDPGASEQDSTRRRAALDELTLPDASRMAALREVAEAFIQARLLVTSDSGGARTLEVSHEALIREWGRLAEWLREARDDIRLQQRLSEDAGAWLRRDQPADLLYRGLLLDEALAWAGRAMPSVLEQEFLAAGLAERARQATAEQAEQAQRLRLAQQAAAADRRAVYRLRSLVGVLVASLLLAAGLTSLALKNATDATDHAHKEAQARAAAVADRMLAESRQLAAVAITHLDDHYDLSLLLGVEANRAASTVEARDSLLRSLEHNPRLLAFLHGNSLAITSVAISPNGRLLAAGGCGRTDDQGACLEGEIRLWDVRARRPLDPPLLGHAAAIYSVAFSPDGNVLASGSADGAGILLWDVARRKPLGPPITDGRYALYTAAFSPNGTLLACASDNDTVVLWDLAHRRTVGSPLTSHIEGVPRVAFSPDGKTVAAASMFGSITLWDLARGRPLSIRGTEVLGSITSVAFSPNGKLLATGSEDGTVELWDTIRRQSLGRPLSGQSVGITSVAFSPDDKTLASASQDGTTRLWDVTHGLAPGALLTGHTGAVNSVSFSPDGGTLAVGTEDGTVLLWDAEVHQFLGPVLAGPRGGRKTIAFSPRTRMLAIGAADGTIQLWDVPRWRALEPPLRGAGALISLAFSPNGAMLASGTEDGTVLLWDLTHRRALGPPLTGQTGGINSIAFSPDGSLLACGSDDKTIMLWDLVHWRPLGSPLTGHSYGVTSLAFSPSGKALVSGSYDGTVRMWDVARRQPLGPPLGHTQGVNSVALSPAGNLLAAGSQDGTVQLWDMAAREPLGQPLGRLGGVSSVAFSPDGSLVAAGSQDGTIQLWDVAHRQPLGEPLSGHLDGVTSVQFLNDRDLVSGSLDGSTRRWDVDPASWQQWACRIANRNLSAQEWHQYLSGRSARPTCPSLRWTAT